MDPNTTDNTQVSPAEALEAAVAKLQTALNRSDRSTAAELGAGSDEDLQILRMLLRTGPMRVGKLAKSRASSMTTTSGKIGRLEKRGLVKRRRLPDDLRAMQVELTKQGRRIAHQSQQLRSKSLAAVASGFPLDLLAELTEVLDAADANDL